MTEKKCNGLLEDETFDTALRLRSDNYLRYPVWVEPNKGAWESQEQAAAVCGLLNGLMREIRDLMGPFSDGGVATSAAHSMFDRYQEEHLVTCMDGKWRCSRRLQDEFENLSRAPYLPQVLRLLPAALHGLTYDVVTVVVGTGASKVIVEWGDQEFSQVFAGAPPHQPLAQLRRELSDAQGAKPGKPPAMPPRL